MVTVVPIKDYNAEDIKRIRISLNMTQVMFASYLGVSRKTVEAWESGVNHPSGIACRLLSMLEEDKSLTQSFPFVVSEIV